MKNISASIVLLFLLLQASAQYDIKLIDTNKVWSTADVYTAGGNSKYSFYHKFGGDTIINNQTYIKIYRSFEENMTEWELHGFIMELDQKYYLRNLANEVGLAYDFGVNIGVTLNIDNPFAFYPFEANVVEIDSVFIEPANQYRKRITLVGPNSYPNITEYWIEGMGSTAGLIHSGCIMGQFTGSAMYTLLCYYESDELVYNNPNYPVCFYPLTNMANVELNKNQVIIYPNPVTSTSVIKVDSEQKENLILRIFDYQGKIVREENIESSFLGELHTTEFQNGIYLISILKNNQVMHSEKFIIQ